MNEEYISNSGCKFIILSRDGKSCVIQFSDTGYVRKCNYDNLIVGKVRDHYNPSVYGLGYYGEFEKVSYWKQAQQLWRNMLKRCYCESDVKGYYGKATVSKDWHCFSNFLKDIKNLNNFKGWLDGQNNLYQKYNLDKDLLIEGCSVYSKDTCQFITEYENKSAGARNGKPYSKNKRVAKE